MERRHKYTRHTPPHIRAMLDQVTLEYPATWTLDQVAEESFRRHRMGRIRRPVQAMTFLANWSLYKLATCSLVRPAHWAYLDPPGASALHTFPFKLGEILESARGADPTWRSSKRERDQALKQLDRAASTILDHPIRVTLHDVAQRYGAMQPLLEASDQFEKKAEFAEFRESVAARAAKEDRLLAVAEAMRTGYTAPTLAHFLNTFRAKLREMDGKDLPDGGGFGAYPRQKSGLRRVVIRNLAWALLDDDQERPNVALSDVIDVVCTAWFGAAPTRNHIDALIRPIRVSAAKNAELRAEQVEMYQRYFVGNHPRTKAKISGGLIRPRK